MQPLLTWLSVPDSYNNKTIPDNIYLQAKRILFTGGATSASNYICRLCGELPEEKVDFVRSFYMRLSNDNNRDDIKLGKCLHCIFRNGCNYYQNAKCPHIDDRFRKLATSFRILAEDQTETVLYDCGWVRYDGKTPRNIFRKSLTLPPITRLMRVEVLPPFSGGLIKNHILPNKQEIYERYCKRVKRYETELQEALRNSTETIETKFKAIINKIGQHDVLINDYGGNLELMRQDYWPYQTMGEVVEIYTHGVTIPISEFINKAREELKQQGGEAK